MSIIESAFLKTLKNSKEKINDASHKVKESPRVDRQDVVEKKPVAYEENHPRRNISAMSQVKKSTPEELRDKQLISSSLTDTSLVNEYRNLRTKLIASQPKNNFATLVTSVVPDHDITHIVANIAMAFALDAGKTALVINADINNNNMDELFDIDLELGIIDYLESDDIDVDDILYETPVSRLRYVPCGRARDDTSEYFTSTKMKKLIASFVDRYPERYTIIIAPSIGASADTRILVDSSDCVILIAAYGKCNEIEINNAMLTIGSKKFAGVILDDF